MGKNKEKQAKQMKVYIQKEKAVRQQEVNTMFLKLVEVIADNTEAFTQIKGLIQVDLDRYVNVGATDETPGQFEKEYVLDGYDRNVVITLDDRQGKQCKMNLRKK